MGYEFRALALKFKMFIFNLYDDFSIVGLVIFYKVITKLLQISGILPLRKNEELNTLLN